MHMIEVENVSKVYRTRRGTPTLFARGGVANWFRRRRRKHVEALTDVTFNVEPGESLGLIGANGSGKSTLLKLLAGVTLPTQGHVRVYGRVASLLELGAGFHPLLTGRENIYLNARILGMPPERVDEALDDIIAFSGLGDFIDHPVDTYSSGMYIRLGFAVAVHTDPDVFLVDEVLSVGDEEFQRRCRARIGELKDQGKTIIFVSHDLSIVHTLCDRVILLSKGKMVVRETPQATIDFYLRQIGQAKGIHTLSAGNAEAILSHGRLSAFREQLVVSAPAGFQVQIDALGRTHPSTEGDWEVVERQPDRCAARGRLSRMPIAHCWDVALRDGRLVWKVALECERETPVDSLYVTLYLPQAYAHWYYGDLEGAFPEILPADTKMAAVVDPETTCREAAAVPDAASALPPVRVTLETEKDYLRLQWANSDYIAGCRILQVGARLPDAEKPLAPGRHELMTIEIDLARSREDIEGHVRAREAERTLTSGLLSARFEHGTLRIHAQDQELTALAGVYTSLLVGNLWNDSVNFQWEQPLRDGDTLRAAGRSRRFPMGQDWEMEVVEEGLALRVWLTVQEPVDVQEYHASICLRSDYDRWQTVQESGAFPPFEPGRQTWQHANRDYGPGREAKALSSALPSVTFAATAEGTPFRMTAINTGYDQNARVLQALRTPEAGVMHFDAGRHLLFEGRVALGERDAT